MAATPPSQLLSAVPPIAEETVDQDLDHKLDVDEIFAGIVEHNAGNATHRLYSTEAATMVARLDWSDASLADRVEAALIVGAPMTTSTRDGVWTVDVDSDHRVRVVNVAGHASLGAAVLNTRLLDLHGEFFS